MEDRMKGTALGLTLILCILAFLALGFDRGGGHMGAPAFAVCSRAEIINNCCFKFHTVMRGELSSKAKENREARATAVFRNCLYAEIGCSKETTEMKAGDYKTVTAICRY